MIPKFRAWNKELKAMFEVKSLVFTLNLATIASKNDLFPSRTCSFDDIILMQSTWLFDKNGKEIFDGDIVYAYSEGARLIGAIEYFDNAYCIKTKNGVYNSLWTNAEYYEIVGNVFENQELMEVVEK